MLHYTQWIEIAHLIDALTFNIFANIRELFPKVMLYQKQLRKTYSPLRALVINIIQVRQEG